MSLLSIPVEFKEVYTANSRNLHCNPNWTTTQLIEIIKPELCREFNIDKDNLEIVEARHSVEGLRLEEVTLPLSFDNTVKIKDKWGPKLDVAFYVRRKNYPYFEVNSGPTVLNGDCPVCLENVALYSRHGCSHCICDRCIQKCLTVNYTMCPVCRQN